MSAPKLKAGDRIIVKPEVALYIMGVPVLGQAGTVLEIHDVSTGPEVMRVNCPGLDAGAWYSTSLFKLEDEAPQPTRQGVAD